jgi:hypothetical protein
MPPNVLSARDCKTKVDIDSVMEQLKVSNFMFFPFPPSPACFFLT